MDLLPSILIPFAPLIYEKDEYQQPHCYRNNTDQSVGDYSEDASRK
jgi:hypothetical protein